MGSASSAAARDSHGTVDVGAVVREVPSDILNTQRLIAQARAASQRKLSGRSRHLLQKSRASMFPATGVHVSVHSPISIKEALLELRIAHKARSFDVFAGCTRTVTFRCTLESVLEIRLFDKESALVAQYSVDVLTLACSANTTNYDGVARVSLGLEPPLWTTSTLLPPQGLQLLYKLSSGSSGPESPTTPREHRAPPSSCALRRSWRRKRLRLVEGESRMPFSPRLNRALDWLLQHDESSRGRVSAMELGVRSHGETMTRCVGGVVYVPPSTSTKDVVFRARAHLLAIRVPTSSCRFGLTRKPTHSGGLLVAFAAVIFSDGAAACMA